MYLFEAGKSSASTCTGACAATWPPVTTASMPMAGSGKGQGYKDFGAGWYVVDAKGSKIDND